MNDDTQTHHDPTGQQVPPQDQTANPETETHAEPASPQDSPQDPLQAAEQKAAEMEARALRALADLQNFKRRTEEERAGLMVFANLNFLKAIFPVIDNFKRAFDHIPTELSENEWVKGIATIEKNFLETLTSLGLQEIPCETGSKFDPNLHEVVMQGPGEKDTLLECFEKGYTFQDKVVRPAKIRVGDGNSQ